LGGRLARQVISFGQEDWRPVVDFGAESASRVEVDHEGHEEHEGVELRERKAEPWRSLDGRLARQVSSFEQEDWQLADSRGALQTLIELSCAWKRLFGRVGTIGEQNVCSRFEGERELVPRFLFS
jgi:hypothetical protein